MDSTGSEGPATKVYARYIWRLIAAMVAATLISFPLANLTVDPFSNLPLLLPFALLGATWWFYSAVRPDRRVRTFAESFSQLMLILLFGTLLSYAAGSVSMPFEDKNLLWIDSALGINRHAYFEFFAGHRWLDDVVTLAYFTLMPQFVVVPLTLLFTNRPQRLQRYTFAVGAALTATVALFVFFPSITTVYRDLGLPVGAHLPAGRYTPLPTLEALRSDLPYSIDLSALEGMISFPSFHTVGALLTIWALWPVRYVRWIALAVNTALIAAAPIVGAHYFIDLAGGAVVALLAIAAAEWLGRRAAASIECEMELNPPDIAPAAAVRNA